jgi:O-antigen biosynthesis protein
MLSALTHFVVRFSRSDNVAALFQSLFSLRLQQYPHWRVQIYPDRDLNEHRQRIELLFDQESRIEWLREGQEDAHLGDEDYLLPLIPGDTLDVDALAQFALLIKNNSKLDLLYSDHFEWLGAPIAQSVFFKPDWSPEFLVATNYIGRAALRARSYQTTILQKSNYDEIDLWRLWLSFACDNDIRVGRVERPIISLALPRRDTIDEDVTRSLKVIDDLLTTRGIRGKAFWPSWARKQKMLVFDIKFSDCGPKVSILIPTRNNCNSLKRCIDSLASTNYRNYEVVVINNDNSEPRSLAYLKSINAKVIDIPSPNGVFSFSYINNRAAEQVNGDYLLFLNDDTEVITPEWLSQMVGWLQFPGVASVGARLIFPNDLVQHAGIVNNLLNGMLPAPTFKLFPRTAIGPRGQDRTVRNYSAVTAACMLTPRNIFLNEGGFDEVDFQVAYNDCDYCFRLTLKGRRHVFVPSAELYHYEGTTRGRGVGNDKITEEVAFTSRYSSWSDPYYNRNLSLDSFNFDISPTTILEHDFHLSGLRVALFTHNLNFEGAPLVLVDIARGLRRLGNCDIVVFSLIDGPLRAAYEELDCEVVVRGDIGIFGVKEERELESILLPSVAQLAAYAIDVVIANTVLCHWGMVAAKLQSLPAVWIIHESEPPFSHLEWLGAGHLAAARAAFSSAYLNVFVAYATRAVYDSASTAANVVVIYNGLDEGRAETELKKYDRAEERRRLTIADRDIVFLLPGIVCERKGQVDLLRAIEKLPNEIISGAFFCIVGDRIGPYSGKVHELARALSTERRRRLAIIPETAEIWRYYKAADALIFTSYLESFPRVIQEAMYCHLPIISTPVFGISEQLRNEQTGLLFQPGDIQSLVAAISRVTSDSSLRKMLGANARLALRRFPSVEKMQERYWRVVQEAYLRGGGRTLMGGDRRNVWRTSLL